MLHREAFIAEDEGRVLGWIDLLPDGHIDMFYCLPEVTRKGVADTLYANVLGRAKELSLQRLFSDGSVFAESFFTKHDWVIDEREVIVREGVEINRARMSVLLVSGT
jgi:N-acetylglutamate synthase-like GNAT family acetyltransferase